MNNAFITVSALALMTAVSTSATAASSITIEEITVTAQKRAQNVQDVPISISAFTAAALFERGVTDVAGLSALAPNVNFDGGTPFSGSSSVLSASIRGIGSDDFAFNIDPGVGVYLDGVYLARTVGANQDLPDVERIEILKGPQGTLFGRNTIGGAISIVTHEPGDEFHVKGDVTTGRFNLARARATIDLPLAETLKSSLTFAVTNRDGFLKRLPFDDPRAANSDTFLSFNHADFESSSQEGGEDSMSLRGKLKWQNDGPFTATLTGDYSHSNSSAQATKLLAAVPDVPGPFAGDPNFNLPGTAFDPTQSTGFLFAGLYNFCIGSTPGEIAARNAQALCGVRGTQFLPNRQLAPLASVNVDSDPNNDRLPWDNRFLTDDIDTSFASGPSFNKLTTWGGAMVLDYDVMANMQVKSITAYRENHWKAGTDVDGSPLSFLELSFEQNQEQFSQEIQLLGTLFAEKLNYVLGGYYFKEKGDLHDFVTFAEGLLQVDGPNDFNTVNYAAFGQIDFRPIELVGITVGGRYTHERKLFEGGQQDLNGGNYKLFGCATPDGNIDPFGAFPLAPVFVPCFAALDFPDPTQPTRVFVPGVNRKTFNNFSPKVGVQLYPIDDVMAYASWSNGYKTGGWTTRLTNPQGQNAPDFEEEKATTWEVGVKSSLLDKRLQLNLSAFTTDYRNVQLNIQVGTSPTIDNAGDARIRGFELEAVAAVTEGFTINASVGYLDAFYTRLEDAALAVSGPNPFQEGIFIGAPLPKTADWKLNVSPRYEITMANDGLVALQGDWTHVTSLENDIARTILIKRPGYDMLNASVSYTEPDGKWSLTFGGTNLAKERFITSGAANIAAGAIYGTYNRPREWYARLGVEF